MTLDELLAAYEEKRWKNLAPSDRYQVLLETPCLIFGGTLTGEEVRQLSDARERAISLLQQKALKTSKATRRKVKS